MAVCPFFGYHISIHALHEESDSTAKAACRIISLFQSTLSMRRATKAIETQQQQINISIHALHEESDLAALLFSLAFLISIHALHEESDTLSS